MLVMLVSAGAVSRFIDQPPELKILALAFCSLIGVMLVAEGMGSHIEKVTSTSAMAFSSWWSWSTCATGASRAGRARAARPERARRPRAPLPRSAAG